MLQPVICMEIIILISDVVSARKGFWGIQIRARCAFFLLATSWCLTHGYEEIPLNRTARRPNHQPYNILCRLCIAAAHGLSVERHTNDETRDKSLHTSNMYTSWCGLLSNDVRWMCAVGYDGFVHHALSICVWYLEYVFVCVCVSECARLGM